MKGIGLNERSRSYIRQGRRVHVELLSKLAGRLHWSGRLIDLRGLAALRPDEGLSTIVPHPRTRYDSGQVTAANAFPVT